ncbi:MAG: hypothetical protein V7784_07350 [Oceanospirillaceae bacterium]
MNIPILPLTLSIVLLSGCSSDPFKKHVGLWETESLRSKKVMEITKLGDSIIMRDNILDYYIDSYDRKKRTNTTQKTLRKNSDRLSMIYQGRNVKFDLSNNDKSMLVGHNIYRRIDRVRLETINKAFENRYARSQEKEIRCNQLKKEYKNQRTLTVQKFKATYKNKTYDEVNDQLQILREQNDSMKKKFKSENSINSTCRFWRI